MRGTDKRALFALPGGPIAKRIVLAGWLLALAIALPVGMNVGSVQSDKATDWLPGGMASTEVAELAERIPGGDDDQVLVVYHRPGGLTAADRASAEDHRRALPAGFGAGMPPVTSADGSALMYAVDHANPGEDEAVTGEFVRAVRDTVARHPGGLAVQVTGPSALSADVDAVFEGVDETLMLVTTLVVALLLIGTYRSPFLWLLPLAGVGTSVLLAMAAVYGVASAAGITVSTQSISIMIVLVFGAGTDYAMLIVARYREELRGHADPHVAMRAALRGVGPAVLASGSTVVLGLLCMLAARMNNISGLGLIGAIGIGCALVTMLTVLPALLVTVGRRVFWPRVPHPGQQPAAPRANLWGRAADRALARPARSAAISAVLLGGLALGAFTLDRELGETDLFTSSPESVTGYATLGAAFPDLGGRPLTVAAPADQAERVVAAAGAVPGVTEAEVDRSGAGWTLIEVAVEAAPDSRAEADTVRAVRSAVGDEALVGGAAAETVDVQDATGRDTALVLPLVLGVVLLVLVLLLRALVTSLVVVATVVLSFVAALGIGAIAFDVLFGFAGSSPDLPALCFVFAVALGVDYSIFLVARIGDDMPALGTAAATRRALAFTWPVIVSAGVVLAATFSVLMTLPFVPIVQLGFVVAVAVLLQTLVVQPLLVGPLLIVLRRWTWWPGRRERSLRANHQHHTVAEPAR